MTTTNIKIDTKTYDVFRANSVTIATQVIPADMRGAIDAAVDLGWKINSVYKETTVESTREWVVLVRVTTTYFWLKGNKPQLGSAE